MTCRQSARCFAKSQGLVARKRRLSGQESTRRSARKQRPELPGVNALSLQKSTR